MRLPLSALVLASFTFATSAFAADAKKPVDKKQEKPADAGKDKDKKPVHKKTAHVSKKPLGALPKSVAKALEKAKNEAKKKSEAAKADPVKADAKAKPEPKKPEAAKKAPDPTEPPEELTGALPQKKLADKKKPAPAKDEPKDKDPKKAEPKKPELPPLPHGKAAKVSAVPPSTEFMQLQKKATAEKKKMKACLHPAVTFARLGQPTDVSFVLTTCKGTAAPGAVDNLSILARPYDVALPSIEPVSILAKKPQKAHHAFATPKDEIAPGIRRVDPGLISRIQAIADKFPGKTNTLVSGYRPASKGSPHQAARAMDIRIDGVTNEALVAYCKTLTDTGCGYYPNSYFVHVDVRPEGAGHVSWIDTSGPGETPNYVKQWPLPLPTKPQITKEPLPEVEAPKSEGATTTDPSQIGDLEESADESSTTN
jgi:hypothetical protein